MLKACLIATNKWKYAVPRWASIECRSLTELENNPKNGFCWKTAPCSSCMLARTSAKWWTLAWSLLTPLASLWCKHWAWTRHQELGRRIKLPSSDVFHVVVNVSHKTNAEEEWRYAFNFESAYNVLSIAWYRRQRFSQGSVIPGRCWPISGATWRVFLFLAL